jgi:hypothetical protein
MNENEENFKKLITDRFNTVINNDKETLEQFRNKWKFGNISKNKEYAKSNGKSSKSKSK